VTTVQFFFVPPLGLTPPHQNPFIFSPNHSPSFLKHTYTILTCRCITVIISSIPSLCLNLLLRNMSILTITSSLVMVSFCVSGCWYCGIGQVAFLPLTFKYTKNIISHHKQYSQIAVSHTTYPSLLVTSTVPTSSASLFR